MATAHTALRRLQQSRPEAAGRIRTGMVNVMQPAWLAAPYPEARLEGALTPGFEASNVGPGWAFSGRRQTMIDASRLPRCTLLHHLINVRFG